jgi:hypothetical protein
MNNRKGRNKAGKKGKYEVKRENIGGSKKI